MRLTMTIKFKLWDGLLRGNKSCQACFLEVVWYMASENCECWDQQGHSTTPLTRQTQQQVCKPINIQGWTLTSVAHPVFRSFPHKHLLMNSSRLVTVFTVWPLLQLLNFHVVDPCLLISLVFTVSIFITIWVFRNTVNLLITIDILRICFFHESQDCEDVSHHEEGVTRTFFFTFCRLQSIFF